MTRRTPIAKAMRTKIYGPEHEASAWLRKAEAARLAEIDAAGIRTDAVMIAPLIGHRSAPGSRADRTCDRCGAYVPPGTNLHLFATQPRPGVVLVGAWCTRCHDLEVA